jgi:hypothetical protein
MADYYPLLAKALANMPSRPAPIARRAIYERARKALIGQLRSVQPPMAESDIAGEDAALDRAIDRLEAEYGAQPAPPPAAGGSKANPAAPSPIAAPRPGPSVAPAPLALNPRPSAPGAGPNPPGAPAPQAPNPKPPLAPHSDGARENPPVAPLPPTTPPKPPLTPPSAGANPRAPSPAAVAPRPLRVPLPPPAARRPGAEAPPPLAAAAPAAPSIEASSPFMVGRTPSYAPPLAAQRASEADDRSLAPPVAPSPSSALPIPPVLKAGGDAARPIAPGRAPPPRRNLWPLLALIVLIGVVAAIAVLAYLWRETAQDLAVKTPSEVSDKTAPAGQNKIAERIQAPGQAAPAPAAGETPIPTVTVAPVPVAPAAPAAPADNAQSAAAAQTPAAVAAAAAVAATSRAAMLIATANDPQKPTVTLGAAVWSIIPATPGQPSTLAIRIEIEVPDQKMRATVTIRKNADASLPATHTIDLRATFADGAEIKGIKDMGLPQMRKDDAGTGDAISGVRVKINDSYYLIGLTRSDVDAAHNLDLMATRAWFDFPLLLNDDRIAKLTFAKGEAGDRVMAQALDAWK